MKAGHIPDQVDLLAEHLDDDNELVQCHLCTALVVVGCEYQEKLAGRRNRSGGDSETSER